MASKGPAPKPVVPSSLAGLTLSVGILFVAICADFQALWTPDETNTALWQAHYFRKSVQPVVLMQGLVAILFAGGLINYVSALIELVRFKLPQRRQLADAIGIVLFAINAGLAIWVVGPAEKQAGQTYKLGVDAVSAAQIVSLAQLHGVQLVLSIALGYQQIQSWKSSPPVVPADRKRD